MAMVLVQQLLRIGLTASLVALASCGGDGGADDAETLRGVDQAVQSADSGPDRTAGLPSSLDENEYDRLAEELNDLPDRSVPRLEPGERLSFASQAEASEQFVDAIADGDFTQADRILASVDQAGRGELFSDALQASGDAWSAARDSGDYADVYRFEYYSATTNSPDLWRLDGDYLRGRVTDAQTGAPISGATLGIQEPWASTAQTDDSGGFELLVPGYPPVPVTIQHPDYETKFTGEDRNGLRVVPSELQGQPLHFELVASNPVERPDLPALTFRGRVMDATTGEPIAGIPVVAAFEPIEGAPDVNLQMAMGKFGRETDAEGRFEITELPMQTVQVLAQGPHGGKLYLYKKSDFTFDDGVEHVIKIESREVRLDVPLVVAGTVLDSTTGEPVTGARVSAGGWKAENTDVNGRFMIQLDTGQAWELTASHEAYHTSPPQPFSSDTGGTVETEFLIDPITTGTILGVAINSATGEPIANAVIEIAGQRIRTDASGRFRAEEIESGEITVNASQSGFRADSQALLLEALQTAEATLELEPITTGTITGVVIDESNGNAIAGVAVRAGDQATTTSDDGRFLLEDVEAGTIEVAASKALYVPGSSEVILEAMATADTRVALAPITWGSVHGRVTDATTGEPLAGASLRIGATQVATAADGTFVAERVPAGELMITAGLDRYHDATAGISLPRDGDVEQSFELAPITTGTVYVTVTDSLSGAPIPAADVMIGTHRAVTDEAGQVLAEELPAGRLVVNAGARLYEPGSAESVLDAAGESRIELELVPITYGTVFGTVVDRSTGAPLANATVRIGGESLRSRDDGTFRAERVPAGSVTVSGELLRYRGDQRDVALERGSEQDVRLELDPITTGTVRGVVRNAASGEPVAGATITVGRLSGRSDGEGLFEISDVPAGDASVRASLTLYEPGEKVIEVEAAGTVSTELEIVPITYGTIGGTVVDANSRQPVSGASVSAGGQRTQTDAAGAFELLRVPAGDVGVLASKPVYVDNTLQVALDAGETETITLRLEPITWGTVTGVVTDAETGRPLADATVVVGTRSLQSAADGRFTAERVPAGALRIGATLAAYEPGSMTTELPADGEQEVTLSLAPIRIGNLAGQVIDAKTNEPIAQARVTVGRMAAETDAKGLFEFDDVDTGRTLVAAMHPDYANGSASAEVMPAETVEVTIRLDLRREDVTSLEAELASSGTIDLYGIYFDSGKAQFKPSSLSTLRAVLEVMKRAPERSFRIAGHTDSDGGDDYNQDLSERRAGTVIQWLADNGIDASRLSGVGFGEARPAAPNDTESGKALNRRVQLSFADGG